MVGQQSGWKKNGKWTRPVLESTGSIDSKPLTERRYAYEVQKW